MRNYVNVTKIWFKMMTSWIEKLDEDVNFWLLLKIVMKKIKFYSDRTSIPRRGDDVCNTNVQKQMLR